MMFRSELVIQNKTDLLPHLDYDLAATPISSVVNSRCRGPGDHATGAGIEACTGYRSWHQRA